MELNFVQIQVITNGTNNVVIYALDSQGKVWFKNHTDNEWQKTSMLFKGKI